MSRDRGGFTMIEMLVVAVLGGLLLLSTYQVLITNQRTYTAQNAKIEGQQITRAALDALASELRELNPTDLITLGQEQVTFRAQREFAIACSITYGVITTVDARRYGDWMSSGDSVFVFADNQVTRATDDAWIEALVTAVDTTQACPDGTPAQRLSFLGQTAMFLADSVRAGAPIRSFDRYTYGRFDFGGESWIGRQRINGLLVTLPTPLIGPIPASFAPGVPGVEFNYFDSSGSVTAVPANVAQIELRVRTKSQARNASGDQITDSLVTRIYLRN